MAQEFAKRFYRSKQWQRVRKAYLTSQYNKCERCGSMADIVHHKKKITPGNINDPFITLNWDNLESLCQDCHNREHMSTGVTAPGISFDPSGQIVFAPPRS
jgi:5-methylcytosine-specific restriction endonuclease McrA